MSSPIDNNNNNADWNPSSSYEELTEDKHVVVEKTSTEVVKEKVSNAWNSVKSAFNTIGQKLANAGRAIKALPGRVSKFLKAHKREALIAVGVALVILGAVTPLGFIPAAIGGGMIVYNGVKLQQERK